MVVNKLEFVRKVPNDRLKHAIEVEKVECDKGSISAMLEGLLDKKPSVVEDVFLQYRYAGKTAVNIFEALNFPRELNNKDSFLAHLKQKLGLSEIVSGFQLRPVMTITPQVNLIEDLGEAILLQWVTGEEKVRWNSYDVVETLEPSFEYMLIRFGNPIFIELRSGYSSHKKFLNVFSELLSMDGTGLNIEWIPVTKVTEAEAEEISKRLNAGLLESEVIGEGCIGKLAAYAAPGINDLKQEQQYKDMMAGREYLAQVFHINYDEVDTGYSTKVKFRINHKGGFEFKSKVSERIIRKIIDVFVEVRYPTIVSNEAETQAVV